MKVAIHFVRFGPYHRARLRSARQAMGQFNGKAVGIEVCSSDAIYQWSEEGPGDLGNEQTDSRTKSGERVSRLESDAAKSIATVFAGSHYESIAAGTMRAGIFRTLNEIAPDAVAISGWASGDAMACLNWAQRNRRPTILMSETRHVDGDRLWWKERLKSRRVKRFGAALVGAKSHVDYLVELGMPSERIVRGYNTVDNEYFEKRVDELRSVRVKDDATPYFLASSRFVPIKNLLAAVDAFDAYRSRGGVWNLCLLGDGPLRSEIIARGKSRGLRVLECAPWDRNIEKAACRTLDETAATIYLPGFRQIDELPSFYSRAAAFFHPALSEPWGLVINEAMASGLPIVASSNGGAAEELLNEGVNGTTFDPKNVKSMAMAMLSVNRLKCERRQEWGHRSRQILAERMPSDAFGIGLRQAVQIACGQDAL